MSYLILIQLVSNLLVFLVVVVNVLTRIMVSKDNTLSLFGACAPGVVRSEARTPRKKGAKTLYRFYVWNFIDMKYRPLSGLFELSKAKELDSLGEIYYKIRFEY